MISALFSPLSYAVIRVRELYLDGAGFFVAVGAYRSQRQPGRNAAGHERRGGAKANQRNTKLTAVRETRSGSCRFEIEVIGGGPKPWLYTNRPQS